MPNSTLYYARTGNSLRAAVAVELAGIEVDRRAVDMPGGEHKRDWFVALNPAGAVPVLVEQSGDDETFALTQSGAIMAHLVDRHRPALWPAAPADKSRCMASFIAALGDVAVQNGLARYLESRPEASKFVFERLTNSIRAAFAPAKTQPFLCGDYKTIADYAHLPVIYMRAPALAALPEFEHVTAWLARMQDDPAVARAIEYAGLQLDA